MRRFLQSLLFLVALAARGAGTDGPADELARIHIAAMGGAERIAALKALRATGQVFAAGRRVRFSFVAERPDHVRVETEAGGRTLVQASDGREPPWEFDTGRWPPHYDPMPEAVARTFLADAEFDDPIVAGARRGFALKLDGEADVDGTKLVRVVVTWKQKERFLLMVDPETYLIRLRVEQRANGAGKPVQVITRYGDFRPVNGVLLPYEVTVIIDGKITQQTKIDSIDPNPQISSETFSRPTGTASRTGEASAAATAK
jgi:hypothetical protein